jgi:hypothetical protein
MHPMLLGLAAFFHNLFTAEADDLARQTGLCRRRRKLDGPNLAQALVFGWMQQPDASLDALAAAAPVPVTASALDQRLTPAAAEVLRRLLQAALAHEALAANPEAAGLLGRFAGVHVHDASTIALPAALAGLSPGCGGSTPGAGRAACKLHERQETTRGGLMELELTDGRTNELESPVAHAPLPPGALRLADLGYFDLERLRADAAAGVLWVSRAPAGLTVAGGPAAPPVKLAAWLRSRGSERVDAAAWLGAARLPARVVAVRLPAAVAARRLARLRAKAAKRGDGPVSAAVEELAGWDVALTNLPAGAYAAREVLALRRLRWQVELFFKWCKGHGHLDRVAGARPERVAAELYARLLGLVVQGRVILAGAGGMLRYSYWRAGRRLRAWGLRLMDAVRAGAAALAAVLARLAVVLARCRKVNRPGASWLIDIGLLDADGLT